MPVGALSTVSPVAAGLILLGLEVPSPIITRQGTQSPCIFRDPSYQNPAGLDQNPAGFDCVLFPSGGTPGRSYNDTTDLTDADDPQNPHRVAQILGVTGGLTGAPHVHAIPRTTLSAAGWPPAGAPPIAGSDLSCLILG